MNGVDPRVLDVVVGHQPRAQLVAGHAEAAGRERGILGQEAVRAELLQHVGPELELALVAGDRRKHLGGQHDAGLAAHVVVHSLGMDFALALAKDDVALHVDFQRPVARLNRLSFGVAIESALGPDHQVVGVDVDRAEVIQAIDDDVHARFDDHHHFVRVGVDRVDLGVGIDGAAALQAYANHSRRRTHDRRAEA